MRFAARSRPFVVLILVFFGTLAVWASPEGPRHRLDAFNARITSELESQNVEAAELFVQADEARDAGQLEMAAFLYARVIDLEPGFVHATRRLCLSLLGMDHREAALTVCRDAVGAETSAENMAALALALARSSPEGDASPEELDEAQHLARRASTEQPDDFFSQTVLCEVAMIRFDLEHLQVCTSHLARIAPDEVVTPYFATILAIGEQRQADALESLERARELGLPDDTYFYLSNAIGKTAAEKGGFKPARRRPSSAQVAALVVLHLLVVFVVWGGVRRLRTG